MTQRYGSKSCSGGPEFQVPDFATAFYGLRRWGMSPKGWLTGLVFHQPWVEGENVAHCLQVHIKRLPFGGLGGSGAYKFNGTQPVLDDRYIPVPCPGIAMNDHGCGFYAWHVENPTITPGTKGDVCGIIAMYGDLEFGPLGMRSSKARIIAISAEDEDHLKAIPRRYNVPYYPNKEAMLESHPLSDVSSLI